MLAKLILTIMLTLMPPGKSIYSQVPVPKDAPSACINPNSLLCAAPKLNPHWGPGIWTRPETAEEGLARYQVIARAMSNVASKMTCEKVKDCTGPRTSKSLRKQRPWMGSESELIRYLLTITYHESGWRRDVHAGIGAQSKGDSGRSWCLGQIMLGKNSKKGKAIVGTDLQSTEKCLETATRAVSHARNLCVSPWGPEVRGPACVLSIYGGSASIMRSDIIGRRLRTLAKIRQLWKRSN